MADGGQAELLIGSAPCQVDVGSTAPPGHSQTTCCYFFHNVGMILPMAFLNKHTLYYHNGRIFTRSLDGYGCLSFERGALSLV